MMMCLYHSLTMRPFAPPRAALNMPLCEWLSVALCTPLRMPLPVSMLVARSVTPLVPLCVATWARLCMAPRGVCAPPSRRQVEVRAWRPVHRGVL